MTRCPCGRRPIYDDTDELPIKTDEDFNPEDNLEEIRT